MDRTDLLEDVLATTDSLHGVVLSWPYKPSHERYLEISKNLGFPVYKNIATILHRKPKSNLERKNNFKKDIFWINVKHKTLYLVHQRPNLMNNGNRVYKVELLFFMAESDSPT